MKKRRELDALVNGKLGHRKKKGQHELLRNDTDSSEVEEFAIPQKAVVRKSIGISRLCSMCLTACGFFLITACVVAVIGLVWVHVELKKDVDDIRNQLRRVESGSQGNPEEFQQLHTKQQELESIIQSIKLGPNSVDSQQKNIDHLLKQIATLNSTTSQISQSIAAAPQLQSLPKSVAALEQNVAKMGSDISTLQETVKQLSEFKTSLSAKLEDWTQRLEALEQLDLSQVTQTLNTVNASLSTQVTSVKSQVVYNQGVIDELHNVTEDLVNRLSLVELQPIPPKPGENEGQDVHALIQDAVTEALSKVQNMSSSEGVTPDLIFELREELDNCTKAISVLQEQYDQLKINPGLASLMLRVARLESKIEKYETTTTTTHPSTQGEIQKAPQDDQSETPQDGEDPVHIDNPTDKSKSAVNPLKQSTDGDVHDVLDSEVQR